MKNKLFIIASLFAAVMFLFTVSSCNKDENPDDDNPILVEDGIYVVGAGTALTDYDAKGLMQSTRNEVTQEDRTELLELYVAVKAGNDGFNIVKIEGGKPTVYGPGDDFAEVTDDAKIGDEPKKWFARGSLKETENKFTVPEDGLYHVVYDKELNKVVVAKVEWGVIGGATVNGWTESVDMPAEAFDLNKMTFKVTDLKLYKGDYKFRYSNGWKIVLDDTYDLGDGKTGVRVNTNFGGTLDNLVPGGANITNEVMGVYTVTLTWELGKGYTATAEKTGDIEAIDYSNTVLGLTGDGVYKLDNPDEIVGWGPITGGQKPQVDGTTYTWTWNNVKVTTAGSFKIKDEDPNWGGKIIGYNEVTLDGAAKDDFGTNNDGNFVPKKDATYNMVLVIDALTETYTLTIGGDVWSIIGSAVGPNYDWTNDIDMTYNETDKVWEVTTDLHAGEFKFRKNHDWGTNYGDDNADGTLDASGANIKIDADGNYTIKMDLVNLTYSVTKN